MLAALVRRLVELLVARSAVILYGILASGGAESKGKMRGSDVAKRRKNDRNGGRWVRGKNSGKRKREGPFADTADAPS